METPTTPLASQGWQGAEPKVDLREIDNAVFTGSEQDAIDGLSLFFLVI